MKVFFRTIHLYLSLAAGLVILTACLTGAILVFEKELEEAFHPDRYHVNAGAYRKELSELIANAKSEHPKAKLAGIKVYSDPERTVEVGLTIPQKEEKKEDKVGGDKSAKKDKPQAGQGGPRPTHTAFLNPYTGKVIEVYSAKGSFFQTTMALHRWLLGKNDGIGKYIVGVATFIFLFILITGVILWWPKTRRIFLQRIKVKWDGNWKRLNHDLHLVFGFYSAIFLFIFAFTAMSWSFEWFNKGIYKITNTSSDATEPPSSNYNGATKPISIDEAFITLKSAVTDGVYYNIRFPKDSVGTYTATVLPPNVAENRTDTYYIDQYNQAMLGSLKFSDKNSGQQVRTYIKPIHTSSIFGLPSKILGFVVCLLGVTFPITGVIMWQNRLKAERIRKRKAVADPFEARVGGS